MIDFRMRSVISKEELDSKIGKIIGPADFNLLVTGSARVRRPDGSVAAVFVKGGLLDEMDELWPVLSAIRLKTENRGAASGSLRVQRGNQTWSRARAILSGTLGAVDPGVSKSKVGGQLGVCRLTSWTGRHLEEWHSLRPMFLRINDLFREHVPERWEAQAAVARQTHPDWLIPGTVFTTVTINNTYSTGVHQDAGDLPEGFSTLAVGRRGAYRGGVLVLPRFRLAFDIQDGDLLLFDAHEWHGNTEMFCDHVEGPLAGPCPEGCERVSLVTYFRTKVADCGSADEEFARIGNRMESPS